MFYLGLHLFSDRKYTPRGIVINYVENWNEQNKSWKLQNYLAVPFEVYNILITVHIL